MRSILLIEDNKELAGNFSLLLQDKGFKVVSAYTGSDGLKKVLENKPDIILCDIMLPDISGYKLLLKLKTLDRDKFPIFIFITAKNQRQDFRKGMELGADDYITKPFTFQELIASIKIQLTKRKKLAAPNKIVPKDYKLNHDENKVLHYNDYIYLDDKKNRGFFLVNSIILVRSMKDYSKLTLLGGKRFILRKSMTYWEKKLPADKFLRVHKQSIINIEFIEKMETISSNRIGLVVKSIDEIIEVSQRNMKKLKAIVP